MALCSILSAESRQAGRQVQRERGACSHRGIGVAPRAKRKAQKGLRLMNGKGLPLAAPRFAPPAFDPWVQQSPQPLRASKGPNGFNFNLMHACPNTLIVFSGTSRVVLIATNQGRAQDFNNGYSKLGRTKIFFTAKDLRHTSDHNLKLFNIDMH